MTDTFTIEIEATTFLEKLKEAGVVDAGTDIGAFAGLTFQTAFVNFRLALESDSAAPRDSQAGYVSAIRKRDASSRRNFTGLLHTIPTWPTCGVNRAFGQLPIGTFRDTYQEIPKCGGHF